MALYSSRVMKANEARGGVAHSTFNYEDVREQAQKELTDAREEAARTRAAAQVEAAALRDQARAEATEQGRREGLAAAEQTIQQRISAQAAAIAEAELRSTLPALNATIVQLQLERDRWLAWWEQAAVRLATAIAARLVRAELSQRPDLLEGRIAELLELAAGQPHLVLKLHPDDLARLRGIESELLENLSAAADVGLVPDPTISPGGCIVESTHGQIDGRLETQLERITQELMG
jgi:flagellar assembly protein FliH